MLLVEPEQGSHGRYWIARYSGQADGVAASAMRQRREARSRVYEPLVKRSGWSGLNRRVGRHDRGRAWLERAVTVVT